MRLAAIFLSVVLAATSATAQSLDPEQCKPDQFCRCYLPGDVVRIRDRLADAAKCELALREKEALIEERIIRFGPTAGPAWWQEPSVVFGGVVVSLAVGTVLGVYLASK